MISDDISIHSVTYDAPIRIHQLGNVAVVAAYGDECFSVRFASTPHRRSVDIGIDGVSLTKAPLGWSPATAADAPRGIILPGGKPGEVKAWAESREGGRALVFTYNVDAGVGLHTGHADSPFRKTIAVNVWKEGALPVHSAPPVRCKEQRDFERAARIIDFAITDIEEALGDTWPRFKGEYDLVRARAKTTTTVSEWEERWAEMVAMASRYRGIRRLIEDEGPASRAQSIFRGNPLGEPVTTGAVGAGEYVSQVLAPTGPLVMPTFEGSVLIHWAWWHEFRTVVEEMHALIERNFPATLPNHHRMANLGTTPSLGGSTRGQAAHRGYERLVLP